MYAEIVNFIREQFDSEEDFIPLHEPKFIGNEKKYVCDAIDSTFVSYVGEYVNKFEDYVANKVGSKYAIATNNGTAAIHIALLMAGVRPQDEVITQPLTFVATVNAISYSGASPLFLDVDLDTLGLSPESLKSFLLKNAKRKNGETINVKTGRRLSACLPMHTFGFPCRIDQIMSICNDFEIPVVEDAAESLGSLYNNRYTGTFGLLGTYSFNGNKTVTSGGGGAIITDDSDLAMKAKHLTTTAKVKHPWEYIHDAVGYNYRMPNLNAALALAQMENLDSFIQNKRELASRYANFFRDKELDFVSEPSECKSNYWLMAINVGNVEARNEFLKYTNDCGVMTRPIWRLMHKLDMFKNNQVEDVRNAEWLEDRIINIPSSVRWFEK